MGRRKGKPQKRGRRKIKQAQSRKDRKSTNTLTGTLKMHREGGYGFLLPDDPGQADIFIPLRRMGGALDLDHVRVSYWSDAKDGRFEGAVEEILERGRKWFVGTLKKENQKYVVSCEGGKGALQLIVEKAELKGARLGDAVGVEAVEYPEGQEYGVGRVIQLFGARGDEKTEVDIVILKHQLPTQFKPETLAAARAIAEDRNLPLTEDRQDLRFLPLVTIDGETARDFDDAVCVKQEGKFHRLWVSIADVSYYVTPGSPIDREAFARGTSVYFTNKVLPMLPEELSNDLCSLRPHEDRYAFTAEMLFDERGLLKESKFYKSLIRSQARLTYTLVAKSILEKDPLAQRKVGESLNMLEVAFGLFRLLRKARLQRGSIDFDLPEPEVILDLEEGDIETIGKAERTEAHMLIEEFMVAANEAVAQFITSRRLPMIYRVHAQPDPEKIKSFQELLHNLGIRVKLPKNPEPKDMGRVLKAAAGHAEERLVQHFLLRSMKQAIYSPKNEGHYGLASPCYTHFTSPIRRYPDLVVHRILDACLRGKEPQGPGKKFERSHLTPIATHSSRRERIAMEAEWEALDLMTALFMKKFLGENFKGMVARVNKFGFFVELELYFVQGLVLLEDIKNDYFFFDEKHHRLQGRRSKRVFKIGTEVSVQVAKVDIEERRVYFALLD